MDRLQSKVFIDRNGRLQHGTNLLGISHQQYGVIAIRTVQSPNSFVSYCFTAASSDGESGVTVINSASGRA